MSDSMVTPLVAYLGWSFLPNLATSWLLNIYYKVTVRAGTYPPRPGTPQFIRDYRRVRILVLTLYLTYTLLQSLYDTKLAGDFYTLFSINPYTTTDREIKSKFRRLAAKYHPDKLAQNIPAGSQPADTAEAHFLHLRLASETLTHPATRYAYTHFGPRILSVLPSTINPTTNERFHIPTSQLVVLALRQKIPSYLVSLAFLYILNTFLLPTRRGQFWRYFVVAASAVLELYLFTHEIPPIPALAEPPVNFLLRHTPLGHIVPPHLLPYQILNISQSLALSLNIFISQVAAVFPSPPSLNDETSITPFLQQLNNALSALSMSAQTVDKDATNVLATQLAPFKGDVDRVQALRRGMKEGMVLGVLKDRTEVREAVRRALFRRRVEKNRNNETGEMVREDGDEVVDLLGSAVKL